MVYMEAPETLNDEIGQIILNVTQSFAAQSVSLRQGNAGFGGVIQTLNRAFYVMVRSARN
jgi:hypothetical protein